MGRSKRNRSAARRGAGRGTGRGSSAGRASYTAAHRFERTDRVGELVRDVVASEMERLDEEFSAVVITGVDVDRELATATVYYDLRNPEDAEPAAESFEEHHPRFQKALGQQTRLRRTPHLRFRLDESIAAADRITQILNKIRPTEPADGGAAELN